MDLFDLRLWKGFKEAGGDDSQAALVDQITIDSRRIDSRKALFVALKGDFVDGHQFIEQAALGGAKFALVKKDWATSSLHHNLKLLRVENPLSAFQEICKTYRQQKNCKIIGITGSYGKTMIKDLLQLLLATKYKVAASPESFNSQIGVPLSLLTIKEGHEIAIIEAAISKEGEMGILQEMIAPHCGILSPVGKKHQATLPDKEKTAREMMKLFSHENTKEWILLPDDPSSRPFQKHLRPPFYLWNNQNEGLPHASFLSSEKSSQVDYQVQFPDGKSYLGQIQSGFYYFIDLINIAVKAAWLLGIDSSAISGVLTNYEVEPMRREIWKTPEGTTLINDFYGSDPISVDIGLRQLDQIAIGGRKIFIFNGLRKGSQIPAENEYRRVARAIQRSHIDWLLLVGNHPFAPIENELKADTTDYQITHCPTIKDALLQIKNCASREKDTILIKGEKKESLNFLMETFNDSTCNNQCLINLAAVQSNLEVIKRKQPKGTRIMVMVKALAYGTDEVMMAKFLNTCGIDSLGVSYVEEGVNLKRAGVTQSIFVINAATFEAAKVIKWDLEVGVSDAILIETLAQEAAKQTKKIKVHLHVNTGMGRFGCRSEEALELARLIVASPYLQLEGIMTHFACAENPSEDNFTLEQAKKFKDTIEILQSDGIDAPWKHASNSAAAIRFHFPEFNMVRIGLATYGLYSSEAVKQALELRLALSLISKIVGINLCEKGESISYGRSYRVKKNLQKIAVLPIGYFDGLHRSYSGKGHVMIRGQKAPMVGNICMDFMMVDVTEIPHVSTGDPVLIFGEDEYGQYQSPEEFATCGDSIAHELITCLGPRIQRIFIHEEAHKKR